MRLLEVGGFVVILGAAAVLVRLLWVRDKPAVAWEAYHRFKDGQRRVYVRRGDEREPVGHVAPDDPDYDEKFMALMDRARERAAVLNSER